MSRPAASDRTRPPDLRIGLCEADFAVTALDGPLSSPERLLQALRREILPALSEALEAPHLSGAEIQIARVEIDLGHWPDEPDWRDLRHVLAHKLHHALAPHLASGAPARSSAGGPDDDDTIAALFAPPHAAVAARIAAHLARDPASASRIAAQLRGEVAGQPLPVLPSVVRARVEGLLSAAAPAEAAARPQGEEAAARLLRQVRQLSLEAEAGAATLLGILRDRWPVLYREAAAALPPPQRALLAGLAAGDPAAAGAAQGLEAAFARVLARAGLAAPVLPGRAARLAAALLLQGGADEAALEAAAPSSPVLPLAGEAKAPDGASAGDGASRMDTAPAEKARPEDPREMARRPDLPAFPDDLSAHHPGEAPLRAPPADRATKHRQESEPPDRTLLFLSARSAETTGPAAETPGFAGSAAQDGAKAGTPHLSPGAGQRRLWPGTEAGRPSPSPVGGEKSPALPGARAEPSAGRADPLSPGRQAASDPSDQPGTDAAFRYEASRSHLPPGQPPAGGSPAAAIGSGSRNEDVGDRSRAERTAHRPADTPEGKTAAPGGPEERAGARLDGLYTGEDRGRPVPGLSPAGSRRVEAAGPALPETEIAGRAFTERMPGQPAGPLSLEDRPGNIGEEGSVPDPASADGKAGAFDPASARPALPRGGGAALPSSASGGDPRRTASPAPALVHDPAKEGAERHFSNEKPVAGPGRAGPSEESGESAPYNEKPVARAGHSEENGESAPFIAAGDSAGTTPDAPSTHGEVDDPSRSEDQGVPPEEGAAGWAPGPRGGAEGSAAAGAAEPGSQEEPGAEIRAAAGAILPGAAALSAASLRAGLLRLRAADPAAFVRGIGGLPAGGARARLLAWLGAAPSPAEIAALLKTGGLTPSALVQYRALYPDETGAAVRALAAHELLEVILRQIPPTASALRSSLRRLADEARFPAEALRLVLWNLAGGGAIDLEAARQAAPGDGTIPDAPVAQLTDIAARQVGRADREVRADAPGPVMAGDGGRPDVAALLRLAGVTARDLRMLLTLETAAKSTPAEPERDAADPGPEVEGPAARGPQDEPQRTTGGGVSLRPGTRQDREPPRKTQARQESTQRQGPEGRGPEPWVGEVPAPETRDGERRDVEAREGETQGGETQDGETRGGSTQDRTAPGSGLAPETAVRIEMLLEAGLDAAGHALRESLRLVLAAWPPGAPEGGRLAARPQSSSDWSTPDRPPSGQIPPDPMMPGQPFAGNPGDLREARSWLVLLERVLRDDPQGGAPRMPGAALGEALARIEPDDAARERALRYVAARMSYGGRPDEAAARQRTRQALAQILAGEARARQGAQRAAPDKTLAAREVAGTDLVVTECAGLVLLHPFLKLLFGRLGLLTPEAAIDSADLPRAWAALRQVGGHAAPGLDPLHRLFLGLPEGAPAFAPAPVDDAMRDLVDGLLRSVIAHWGRIGQTSPDGLRETFLQRTGTLRFDEGGAHLRVAPGPFDLLLDGLPWSLGTITLPWMAMPCHVTWREDHG